MSGLTSKEIIGALVEMRYATPRMAADLIESQASTIATLEKTVAEYEADMDRELKNRDHWEEKATELAELVGKIYDVDVGEHSSGNCPIQNALNVPDEYHLPLDKKCKALEARIEGLGIKLQVALDDAERKEKLIAALTQQD